MAFRVYTQDKYHRVEIVFFISYFIILPVLSGVEYFVFEPGPKGRSIWEDTFSQLIYGLIAIVPSWFCYKLVIQKFLFKKKYIRFILYFILYLILRNVFKFSFEWLIAQMTFLPESISSSATYWYKNHNFLHIVSIYDLRDTFVLIGLAYILHSLRQDKIISNLKQQQLETELNFLKVQIHPHFFFNTLNNIYALTIKKSDKAAPLVAKHADIMRHILYESSKEKIKLRQEIEFLRNYTEVEAMHYSEKTDIRFETQGINDEALIEPMLLLPFTENTFKHGLRGETGHGFIHIVISLVENDLFAEIKNSKPKEKQQEKTTGIGLQNVSKRLEMLYPGKHKIEIEETEQWYALRLSIILEVND
jgi:sensor histidine kinase YesM